MSLSSGAFVILLTDKENTVKKLNRLGIKKVTLRNLDENTLNDVAAACCPTVSAPTCICTKATCATCSTCAGQKTCLSNCT